MSTRWTFPALAVVVLLQSAVARTDARPPKWVQEKSVVQKFCERIYPKWFRIHSASVWSSGPVRADIKFDPKSGTVTLEHNADTPTERIILPSGMTWRAFHITVHGVRELSFPVVLTRPHHHEQRSPQDDEEILIIGDARKTQLHFHIGSRMTGVTAGGSGRGWGVSKRESFKFIMPANVDAGFHSKVSMLPASARNSRPSEFIVSDSLRVEVVRKPLQ